MASIILSENLLKINVGIKYVISNMKRALLILYWTCCIFNYSYSQTGPPIQWQNTIGGSTYDFLFSLKQTQDNGFILSGSSSSDISGDKTENSNGWDDYWILKIDSIGTVQWQNSIGGNEDDYLFSMDNVNDGGYILGGYSYSDSSGDKTEYPWAMFTPDYWIVKIDSIGNIQWENTIGGTLVDQFNSISQTSDNGFILGGWSNSGISGDKTENSNGNYDFWIVKIDSIGNIQWQNTIGGSAAEDLRTIEQTIDGGYIIGGTSISGISGDKTEGSLGYEDYWIVKIDSIGNIQWENTIGGSYPDLLYVVRQTVDGGYIVGGASQSGISGDKTENSMGIFDYWVVKTDSVGNIEWQQTIGGSNSDYLYNVLQTTDGGYILAGSSMSNITGDKTENSWGAFDYWIMKIDSVGNILWQNTIGGNEYDVLNIVEQLADGSFILGGYSKSTISGDKTEDCLGNEDYWIVKLGPDPTGKPENNFSNSSLHIFPNPSDGNIQLDFNASGNDHYSVEILNILGEEVYNVALSLSGKVSVPLDLTFLPNGIYLVKISDGKSVVNRLIVIEYSR